MTKVLKNLFFGFAIVLILVCFISISNAQNKVAFRHIGKKDGLSQSSVFAIAQDETGFMWFGTRDGLNRYDGYRFVTYRKEEGNSSSLVSNNVRKLFYDQQEKALWIGTISGLSK